MTDLWTEATYDAEAEQMARQVTAARVSAVDVWPFLAAAEDERDYVNRKAIVAERLDQVVSTLLPNDPVGFGVVRSSLEASFDEDYRVIATQRAEEAQVRQRVEATLAARQHEAEVRARVEATLQTQAYGQGQFDSVEAVVDHVQSTSKGKKGANLADVAYLLNITNAQAKSKIERAIEKGTIENRSQGTSYSLVRKTSAKTAASDTGTCGTCGRATSYDRDSRKWTHDNEGPDTQHAVTKASAKTASEDLKPGDKVRATVGNEELGSAGGEDLQGVDLEVTEVEPDGTVWVVNPANGHGNENSLAPGQYKKATKTAATEGPWKAQVAGNGEQVWSENALRFETEEEARKYISDLSMRWFGFDLGRVVPSDTPNREPVDLSDPKITHNFRTGSKRTAGFPPAGGAQGEQQPEQQAAAPKAVERRVDQDPDTGEFVGSEWVEKEGDPNTLVQSDTTFGKNPRFKTQDEANGWQAETSSEEQPEEAEESADKGEDETDTTKPDSTKPSGANPFPKKDAAKTAASDAVGVSLRPGDVVEIAPTDRSKDADTGTVESIEGDRILVSLDESSAQYFTGDRLLRIAAKTAYSDDPNSPDFNDFDPNAWHEHNFGGPEGSREVDGVTVHTFASTDKAYNESQVNDSIKDGDVLYVPSEGVVGVLNEAWPIAVTEQAGAFHIMSGGHTIEGIEGGKYAHAAQVARQVATEGRTASRGRHPFARSAAWIDQARAVVENKGYRTVDPTSGEQTQERWRGDNLVGDGVVLDITTANMLVQVYDALSPENQAKFDAMPLTKAVDVAWSLVSKTSAKTASDVQWAANAPAKKARWFWAEVPQGYHRTGRINEHPCDFCGAPVPFEEVETHPGGFWTSIAAKDDGSGSDHMSIWCAQHTPSRYRAASRTAAHEAPTDHEAKPEWDTSQYSDLCDTCGWPVSKGKDGNWTHDAKNPVEWTDKRSAAKTADVDDDETVPTYTVTCPGCTRQIVPDGGPCPVCGWPDKVNSRDHEQTRDPSVIDYLFHGLFPGGAYANRYSDGNPYGSTDDHRPEDQRQQEREFEQRKRDYYAQHPDEPHETIQGGDERSPVRQHPNIVPTIAGRRIVANPYSVSGNPYVAPMATPGTPDDVLDGPPDPNPPVLDMPMTTRPRKRPDTGQTIPATGPVTQDPLATQPQRNRA